MQPIEPLERKGYRQFGILLALFVLGIFGFLIPFIFNQSFPIWPWVVAVILLLFATIYPNGLKLVYSFWMKFGNIIGWFNTRFLLGMVFYFLIVPIGFVMRLMGYDPMQRKFEKQLKTYWNQPNQDSPPSNMENPY